MKDVREVRTDDEIEDIVLMARAFHAEVGAPAEFEAECIREYGRAIQKDFDREHYTAFIAYLNGDPVGFLVCTARPYFFSRQIIASQELWYVRPAFRGTRIAFDLIRAFEDWARLRGAVELVTGVMNKDADTGKKIGKILTKIGYPRFGSYHRKLTFGA